MKSLLFSLLLCPCVMGLSKSNPALTALAHSPAKAVASGYANPIYIAASTLKLHETQSISSKVLLEIPKGAEVKVVNSRFGNWWQVRYKNKMGFTQSTYLKYSAINNRIDEYLPYNNSSLYNSKPTYELNTEVELYEHPSSSSAIQTKLPKGVKVKIIDSSNGTWWLVHYKGRTGNIRNAGLNYRKKEPQQGPVIPVSKLSLVPKSKPTHATTSTLSMRESMSHASAILFEVPKGTAVEVINPNFGDWAQIQYSGKTGFVSAGYFTDLNTIPEENSNSISSSNSAAVSNSTTAIKSLETTAATHALVQETSLRAAPDSKSKVLVRFVVGDQVTVLDDSGEWWWEVIFNGKRGWVKRRLLEAK